MIDLLFSITFLLLKLKFECSICFKLIFCKQWHKFCSISNYKQLILFLFLVCETHIWLTIFLYLDKKDRKTHPWSRFHVENTILSSLLEYGLIICLFPNRQSLFFQIPAHWKWPSLSHKAPFEVRSNKQPKNLSFPNDFVKSKNTSSKTFLTFALFKYKHDFFMSLFVL